MCWRIQLRGGDVCWIALLVFNTGHESCDVSLCVRLEGLHKLRSGCYVDVIIDLEFQELGPLRLSVLGIVWDGLLSPFCLTSVDGWCSDVAAGIEAVSCLVIAAATAAYEGVDTSMLWTIFPHRDQMACRFWCGWSFTRGNGRGFPFRRCLWSQRWKYGWCGFYGDTRSLWNPCVFGGSVVEASFWRWTIRIRLALFIVIIDCLHIHIGLVGPAWWSRAGWTPSVVSLCH